MVYVLLAPGFEESEAVVPTDLLRQAGLETALVSLSGPTVSGSHGITLCADLELSQVDLSNAEMLVLPGGLGGVEALWADDRVSTLIQEAAGKESADQTLKDEANASIQTMADYTVTEAQIENLVIAKGYTDCVAFIGENALSLAVAAPEGGLTDADTARIVDVVNQTAGFSADQVKIIAVEAVSYTHLTLPTKA